LSRRVKVGNTGSRRETDISARTFEEYEEVVRRRQQWAEQQATREQLEQAARQQGWRITERGSERS